jgi:ankyrin repeat protein
MSSLFAAVASSNVDAVKNALASVTFSAQLNSVDPSSGECPLITATRVRNVKVAQLLLEAGANVNQEHEGLGSNRGTTAAHMAARQGDVDLLRLLLAYGADMNYTGSEDRWTPLHTATFSGKSNAIHFLLECCEPASFKVALGAARGQFGVGISASGGGDGDDLKRRLVDVNRANTLGLTPIMFAANHGRLADVRAFLSKKARIDMTDANGDNIYHHALHYHMSKLFEGDYPVPDAQFDIVVVLAVTPGGPDPAVANPRAAGAGSSSGSSFLDGLIRKDGTSSSVTDDLTGGAGAATGEPTDASAGAPTEFFDEDIPSLRRVLSLLYQNAGKFASNSTTMWNYRTFLAARVEHFIAIGLSIDAAVGLYEAFQRLEVERLKLKEELAAERPSGGCPVMRGGNRKQRKAAAAAATTTSSAAGASEEGGNVVPPAGGHHADVDLSKLKPGEDPSKGQCPFFSARNKSASIGADAKVSLDSAAPVGNEVKAASGEKPDAAAGFVRPTGHHTDVDLAKLKPGEDPSKGQCPFFAMRSKQGGAATTSSGDAAAPPSAPVQMPYMPPAYVDEVAGSGGGPGSAGGPSGPTNPRPYQQANVTAQNAPANVLARLAHTVYDARVTILCVLLALVTGMLVERERANAAATFIGRSGSK